MSKILLVIVVLLSLSGIRLYGQSSSIEIPFSEKEWRQIQLNALNMYAENMRLKAESRADFISLVNFQKALNQSELATKEAERIGQDYHGLLTEKDKELTQAKKEVKKQKFLKWLFIGLGAVAVVVTK